MPQIRAKQDMKKSKLLILVMFIAAFYGFYALNLQQYLDLNFIKNQQILLVSYFQDYPVMTVGLFMLIYISVTALSFPGAALLTLLSGAIFGLVAGTIIVSFASTIGATCAFLFSRYLLRDSLKKKFPEKFESINKGIEKEGPFYLFTLRLVPVFPFFMINAIMGLTTIKTFTFFWVSQLGMLAGTLIFVNAGTELAKIESLSGILTPPIILSFCLLGVFPLITKKILNWVQHQRVYRGFKKPKVFDANMVVIGAGAAGLVSSYISSAVKAKTILIEKHKMGGDCLNTGCVPSKAIIRSAKVKSEMNRAGEFGLDDVKPTVQFGKVMERVHRVIKKIEPHDSIERYQKLGVECVQGEARLMSPWSIEVNGETITARNIVIATGARPFVPPIPGIEEIDYLTSDTLWDLKDNPGKMIIIGGGPIGCELTQALSRLDVDVTQVEQSERLMKREDPEVSQYVLDQFTREGIQVHLNSQAVRFEKRQNEKFLIVKKEGIELELAFDQILIAIGRKANTSNMGLEEIGVQTTPQGTIEVNEYLQTRIPNIYACGDVAGPYQFTHTAAHQAWYVAVNGLFGQFKKFKVDYRVIPWATYIDPEVARVGLNEQEAKAQGIPYEITRYGIDDLDRAITDEEDKGFVKVLTQPNSDRILGATIVGYHSGEVISEFVLAMKHGIGLNKILGTIHIYPTLTESNKYLAGEWKRSRVPARLLSWVERFLAWQRGTPLDQRQPEIKIPDQG